MLSRPLAACLIAAVLILPGATAFASSPPDACCACIDSFDATLAGSGTQTPPPSNQALFCGEFSESEQDAAGQQCAGLGGKLLCIVTKVPANAAAISEECRAQLAEQDIACSSPAGAPLAGGWTLTVLAGLLGLAGVVAARRAAR